MRASYYLNPQTPGPADDRRVIREVLAQVDLAERSGFSDVWLTEHHFTGYNVYSDPITIAAAISQRNPSLRIGFAVNVLPLAHPIRFVTRCNLLDQLTDGKLVVGVGPGNAPDEFAGYGVDIETRHERMLEFLDVCDRAWSANGDGFSYAGPHYRGEVRGRIIPAPVQRPRPHIAFASSDAGRLEEAGRRGWSLLLGPVEPEVLAPRMAHHLRGMHAAGLGEEERARALGDSSVLRQIYVAEEGEDWERTIADPIDVYVRKSAVANAGEAGEALSPLQFANWRERYMRGGWLVAGTADEVLERLTPLAQLGIANLLCWMNFGHMEDARIRASLERFVERVLPRLAAVEVDPALLPALVEQSAGSETDFARMWRGGS